MEVGIARRKRRMTQKASWRMEYWSVRILMSWALTALPFRNADLIALNVFRASQRKVRVSLPECQNVNRNGPEEKRNFCRTNPNFPVVIGRVAACAAIWWILFLGSKEPG
jgi:hypothetical protein